MANSNATKLVKPNEKPKEDPTKPQFYNIIYKLTTFFKKIAEKKSLTMKSTSRQRKAMLTFKLSSLINPVCTADEFTAGSYALNQDRIGGVTGIATVEIEVGLAILTDPYTRVPV